MHPQRVGQYRAVGTLIVALGGTLLLAAGRLPVREAPASAALTPKQECDQFFSDDAANFFLTRGKAQDHRVTLELSRHKHFAKLKLDTGAIIGGLENLDPIWDSSTFPELKHGTRGCIWFKVDYATHVSEAWLYHDGGKRQLKLAVYCAHENHGGVLKRPDWLSVQETCKTIQVTTAGATVTLRLPGGQNMTVEDVETLFRQELKRVLPQAQSTQIDAAVKALTDQEGPWYPCDPEGCCRAGDY